MDAKKVHQNSHDGTVVSLGIEKKFNYLLLPGNCPPNFPLVDLHNRAFLQWKEFWNNVFKNISGEKVRSEDFWRQRIICVLTEGDEIAAFHLYSFFHLQSDAAMAHSYFRMNYKEEMLLKLKTLGVQTVMSMEYLTVNPGFRKKAAGFPMASIMVGLGCKVLADSGYDAAVAPCRRDLGVDKRAAEFGAEPLSSEFIHHGVPVINMTLRATEIKNHPDAQVNKIIQNLWAGRQDLSAFPYQSTTKKSAA